jgi:CRISPR-associated protein Csd2
MTALNKKIDFAVIIVVNNSNPNGDPLNGNRPRVTYDGSGEISDVCIKRKIRNRLLEMGHPIFVQSDDNRVDEYPSLRTRAEGVLKYNGKDPEEFRRLACSTWFDVRAFGQVFAFKGPKQSGDGVSVGIRGPVSVHPAFSVAPVSVSSIQITKSVSNEGDGKQRGSDTMGMKHRVDHGVYLCYGSINPQLASKTGFTYEDALSVKDALISLFENDASSARPEGSMEVHKVVWWEHSSPNGQYSSAKVHRSLRITVKDGISEPKGIGDYEITLGKLDGLEPEYIDGR